MEGEYSQEWAELRRVRRRIFRVAAAGAGILVAVPLVTAYLSLSVAKMIGLVLFAAWVVVLLRFFFVSGEYVYWSCPDAASLTTTLCGGMADGTIHSLGVVFTVACPSGWIPTPIQS